MNITSAVQWAGFMIYEDNGGISTIDGNIYRAESSIGSSARASKYLDLAPGETVTITVMARRISGSGETSGGIAIDWPKQGEIVNQMLVDSPEWREYSLSFAAPLSAKASDFCQLTMGVFGNRAGICEFSEPRISVTNSPFGAPRTLCAGLFVVENGTASLDLDFMNFGVLGVAYNTASYTLKVKTQRVGTPSVLAAWPLFFAQMTQDGGAAAQSLSLRVGQYDWTSGEVALQWVNSSTGDAVDISTIPELCFSLYGFM